MPTDEPRAISRKVRLAIRAARRTQRLYAELARELGAAGPFRLQDVAVTDDPEISSDQIRRLLRVPLEQQYEWTDAYAAFRAWRFCNHFSGALLVPRDALAARPELRQLPDVPEEIDARIDAAVRLFKTSRYVILRRLLTTGYISLQGFRRTMGRWLAAEIQPRGGGPQSPAEKALSHFGSRFVSLVLEAHGREIITSSDVSDYLSLKLKHVPQLERLLIAQARG